MQSLKLDIAIIVTATFSPDISMSETILLNRAVSALNASFTHASISAAPYKLSVSKEDRKL
jgi:hypothetical protein